MEFHRYTRNLVDAGNGKFNLMIICWGEGHGSAIHDHADSHCFMKMLQGELREIRYAWPQTDGNSNDDNNNIEYKGSELTELSRAIMETNSVHYINGKCTFLNIFFFVFERFFELFILTFSELCRKF